MNSDALNWYKKAAANGSGYAYSKLSQYYFEKEQWSECLKWSRSGCENNVRECCHILGTMCLDGKGVGKDKETGLALFRKAAAGNIYFSSDFDLAQRYLTGNNVESDTLMAISIYKSIFERVGDQDSKIDIMQYVLYAADKNFLYNTQYYEIRKWFNNTMKTMDSMKVDVKNVKKVFLEISRGCPYDIYLKIHNAFTSTIRISSRKKWTDTGIDISPSCYAVIKQTDKAGSPLWKTSKICGNFYDSYGSQYKSSYDKSDAQNESPDRALSDKAKFGGLLVKVGNTLKSIDEPVSGYNNETGRLMVQINDDNLDNNYGFVDIEIKIFSENKLEYDKAVLTSAEASFGNERRIERKNIAFYSVNETGNLSGPITYFDMSGDLVKEAETVLKIDGESELNDILGGKEICYESGEIKTTNGSYYGPVKVAEYSWKNGKREGVFLEDLKYGEKTTGNYVGGVKSGKVINYSVNGLKAWEANYDNDELNGTRIVYGEYGRKTREQTYVYGDITSVTFYNSTGRISYQEEYSIVQGQTRTDRTEYYENGKLKARETKSGNQLDGDYTSYYDNGELKLDCTYVNGSLDGNATAYHSNGNLMFSGYLVKGRPEGEFTLYYESGDKGIEGNFSAGKLDGYGCLWDESGKSLCGNWDHGYLASANYLMDEINYNDD
jgi:antitoxin component YwqK of YwqJK toxin-antitoxin module